MITYTTLSILAVILVLIIDFTSGVKLSRRKSFWNFWAILLVLLFIINGYLTWRPIVMYNSDYITNFRLFTIPIEDFFYGFSLITLNLIIWEKLTKPHK